MAFQSTESNKKYEIANIMLQCAYTYVIEQCFDIYMNLGKRIYCVVLYTFETTDCHRPMKVSD